MARKPPTQRKFTIHLAVAMSLDIEVESENIETALAQGQAIALPDWVKVDGQMVDSVVRVAGVSDVDAYTKVGM